MESNVETRLKTIFVNLFGVEESILSPDAGQEDIPNWNSLQHLNLVMSIEEEFKIQLGDEDIVDMLSFGLVNQIVEQRLKSQSL